MISINQSPDKSSLFSALQHADIQTREPPTPLGFNIEMRGAIKLRLPAGLASHGFETNSAFENGFPFGFGFGLGLRLRWQKWLTISSHLCLPPGCLA